MITFACVWVQGNVPYGAEYVTRLQALVAKHYSGEHRFVCLTDRPKLLPHVETTKIRPVPGIPGWWSKIELFNPAHEMLRGRVVYLDLDTLPVADLTPIAEYVSPFAMVPHAGTFQGTKALKVVPRYNTSVMVFDVSPRLSTLHSLWNVNKARTLWGDQDYVGLMLPHEDTMPIEWFPRLSEICDVARLNGLNPATASGSNMSNVMPEARVVLSKKPKNHEAAQQMTWFREAWAA